LKRPPPLNMRASSLDSARHGVDVFHRTSTLTAMTALEASDRYLSRHRPDLYYNQQQQFHHQQQERQNPTIMNVFGRTYEIPSNPFDFLTGGGGGGGGGYFGFAQPPSFQDHHHHHSSASNAYPFSPTAFATPTHDNNNMNRGTPFSTTPTTPSPTTMSSNSAFTPIPPPPQQNLAASAERYYHHAHVVTTEEQPPKSLKQAAAHTGQSWQQNPDQHQSQNQYYSSATNAIGNIFRNLSVTSWLNSNNNNGGSRYYVDEEDEDDDIEALSFHRSNDPSLINPDISMGDIELEDLPADYDFPFQDFPRTDGTPCLIYNEDALLERERQRQAKEIFATSSTISSIDDVDYSSGTEKKEDDTTQHQQQRRRRMSSVSDMAFRRMLSDNSMVIDDNGWDGIDDDAAITATTAEGGGPSLAKSPQFQKQLAKLLETKQRRYAMEYKKEVIVQEQRKKRKHIREKQRLERHKAMERDLEEIEAEFFLSPSSLGRSRNTQQQQHQANPPPSLSPSKGDGNNNNNNNNDMEEVVDSPAQKGSRGITSTVSPGSCPLHRLLLLLVQAMHQVFPNQLVP
jgi:hypothetical protein